MGVELPGLDPAGLDVRIGSSYPSPFKGAVEQRVKRTLGNVLGLTHFGVNLVELPPGAWSAQRHWHTREDEFVYVVSGEVTLVTEGRRQVLGAGMVAGFPAGREDGHHLVNESADVAVYLEVGDRIAGDEVHYPDIDLRLESDGRTRRFVDRAGAPY